MEANLTPYQRVMSNVAGYSAVVTCFVVAISTTATTIMAALTALLVLISGVGFHSGRRWLRNPGTICLIAAYMLVLAGSFYSIGYHHDIVKTLVKYSRFIEGALILPIFFEEKWRRRGLIAFGVAVLLTLLVSYIHFYIWPFEHRANLGPASAFKDWIIQSFILALGLALVLPLIRRYRGWRQYGLIALAVLIVFDNFAMSMSRSGYVVTLVVLLFWAVSQLQSRHIAYFLLVVLIALLGIYQLSPTMHQRIGDAWHNTVQYHAEDDQRVETSASFRLEMLKRGIWLFKNRPWIGYGSGAYNKANLVYQSQHPYRPKFDFNSSNTIYLDVMVAYGVIGLLCLVCFLLALWLFATALPDYERYFMRVLLLSMMVGGCFNAWFSDSTPGYLFVLFIALCYGGYMDHTVLSRQAESQ